MKPSALRRSYLLEAAALIAFARLAVRVVPMARVFAWANRPIRRVRRFATNEAQWVAWSVETMGAKPWINALCLPRALATQAMLRRRGILSRLHLGVACDEGSLAAHAWVEVNGEVIVGATEAPRFTPLTQVGGRVLDS